MNALSLKSYKTYSTSSKTGLTELLNNGANIYLGYRPDSNPPFKGCLKDVRLGGALLSFFDPSLTPSPTPFQSVSKDIQIGCVLCWDDDCRHGSCFDRSSSYNCSCSEGYEGEWCDIDKCDTRNPCVNGGTCGHVAVDGADLVVHPLFCSCPRGFTGE